MVNRVGLGLVVAGFVIGAPAAAQSSMTLRPDGGITVVRDGASAVFAPVFTILRADRDPQFAPSVTFKIPRPQWKTLAPENTPLPSWIPAGGGTRTDNLLNAAPVVTLRAIRAERDGDGVRWIFPSHRDFSLIATVRPAADGSDPVISYRLTARRGGWYSVGYTGAPASPVAAVDDIWQPPIWQEKRFPRASILSASYVAMAPMTSVSRDGTTIGVAADPAQIPFAMPTRENSTFGVMVRNAAGEAQPMLFAPVLGGQGSKLAAGASTEFALRPLVTRGSWYDLYSHVARDLFGLRDRNVNLGGSLNQTIDRMVSFAMDDQYSGWIPELKGFNYDTDVPGTVKVVSALQPIATALIRDDSEIYRRRGLPMAEYLMSREKFLFATDRTIKTQAPSANMAGPAAGIGELTALDLVTGGRNAVFRQLALDTIGKDRVTNLDTPMPGLSFWNYLALYRMTGDKAALATARRLADSYVARRVDTIQTDNSDAGPGAQFWVDWSPQWIELLELYAETGEVRYRDAALKGAQRYTSFAWTYPRVPEGNVTVDKGGIVPVHGDFRGWPLHPMASPERQLPAWHVSATGLLPEASNTLEGNPGVMLATHAPYFLELAAATKDPMLHDLARSAVVGRYRNYPGYDINGVFTGLYARADYPLRPFREFSYNNIYYNHVWPQIAMLYDYLVTEVGTRSGGAIAFPSRYSSAYAYLKTRVYGDRPGSFLGEKGVRLWMPDALVTIDEDQLNYLAARGNDSLYLAFANQAPRAVSTTARLDADQALFVPGKRYRVELWRDGAKAGETVMIDGAFAVEVAPMGLTAAIVRDIAVDARFQKAALDPAAPKLGSKSYRVTKGAAGDIHGMLLTAGRGWTSGYVWLAASETQATEARLTLKTGDTEQVLVDRSYPFEFSFPVADDQPRVGYTVEIVRADGSRATADTVTLER